MTVQDRAEALEVFTGGPVQDFERAGRLQLVTLLEQGLVPQSKVLDVGCGCLRAGYWLIHFLDRARYFGIEPNRRMLQAGLDRILEPGLADEKGPAFAHNDDFDLSIFNERFDFVLARSVWTHASKDQIGAMVGSFAEGKHGLLLASYLPAGRFSRRKDYRGGEWVGRSHRSETPGLVAHSRKWIEATCSAYRLVATELEGRELNRQRWLRISSSA